MKNVLTQLLCCATFLVSPALLAQLNLASADWELDYPEKRYRYRSDLPDDSIHLRVDQFELFPTKSVKSGKLYSVYQRWQVAESAAHSDLIEIAIPMEAELSHLDYRIWQNKFIIYEAKSSSIERRIVEKIVVENPVPTQIYLLKIPEIEDRCVIELFYKCRGALLPSQYFLRSQEPVRDYRVQFKVQSANPLKFHSPDNFQFSKKSVFANFIYNLHFEGVAVCPAQYTFCPTRPPQIFIAWADRILKFDRSKSSSWPYIINNLFYTGAIRDFAVFRNDEYWKLGNQLFKGGFSNFYLDYGDLANSLASNRARQWGQMPLARNYAAPLVELEEEAQRLSGLSKVSLAQGIRLINQYLNQYLQEVYVRDSCYLDVFTDYGLFYKYFADFFSSREQSILPVLYQGPRRLPLADTFTGLSQIDAIGYGYFTEDSSFHHQIIGPYAGNWFLPDQVPGSLQGGRLYAFSDSAAAPHEQNLETPLYAPLIFHIEEEIRLSPQKRQWRRKRKINFRGASESSWWHQNLLYAAYLPPPNDSNERMPGLKKYCHRNSYRFPYREYRIPKEQDTTTVPVNWSIFLNFVDGVNDHLTANLTAPAEYHWEIKFDLPEHSKLSLSSKNERYGDWAQLDYRLQHKAGKWLFLLDFKIKHLPVSPSERAEFLALKKQFSRPLLIKMIK